jgi:hemerythrin superfamily protein
MAQSTKTKAKKRAPRTRAKASARDGAMDAIALLEADHREVEGMFDKYEKLSGKAEKRKLATQICESLKVHTQVEEEIFYPAAREAIEDDELLDEAVVEHSAAKTLIAEIEKMNPDEDLYDAKVKVLGEQIKHHVKEEEEELFEEVRDAEMDIEGLGAKMQARKAELTQKLAKAS